MRALEGEMNDERFTNKDLIREVHNLRLDVERAEEEKEKALAAAEKFVQRTVESTSADRETLKGALKELGSSLDTIRSDKARVLQERDMTISERNAQIGKLTQDLANMTARADELEKQLLLSQKMLKASNAASASRFGQTIGNYRSGLITSGFRTWVNWFTYSKLETQIEWMETRIDLLTNAGRMVALKRVVGRWKNQGLYMGWREWASLHADLQAQKRLEHMLGRMTDAERARALERLNYMITCWLGEQNKIAFSLWTGLVKEARQRDSKLKYAARKWYHAHLSRGFAAWKFYATLSAEEQAEIEIQELQWRLKRTLQTWMKDKFHYEARIYSDAQKNRFFQSWKYHTQDVSKTTMRMKMMLGTVARDKARNAFSKFQNAVNVSRLHASDLLDQKLLASAKAKALQKMGRVIAHAKQAKLAGMWRTWLDDLEHYRLEQIDEAFRKQLQVAEAAGYKRARDEFEPDVVFLRNALRQARGNAFAKYLDIFVGNAEKRGKLYCMGMWRSYTKDKFGRAEEEARLKELADLKAALKIAENDLAVNRTEMQRLQKMLRELQSDEASRDMEFKDRLKEMQIQLDGALRNAEMITSTAALDKKHMEAMLGNKERQVADLQQEMAERDTRHKTAMTRMENAKAELEVDVQTESQARKELTTKTRDLSFRTEQDIANMREELQKVQQSKRHLQNDHDVLLDNMRQTQQMLQNMTSDKQSLEKEKTGLITKISDLEIEQRTLRTALQKAQQITAAGAGDEHPAGGTV
jgi:hypothetical protein